MDLISVIVPVYRVEPYLDRCVQSIVDQTYTNLEIILVDDGSPDECPHMCDAWAGRDERIRVIHQENGGLSAARNAGMRAATGDYIAFVDSDDWLEREMLLKLYRSMMNDNSDIASCGALRVWEDGSPSQPMMHFSGDHVLDGKEALKALIQSTYLIQVVWNKLYNRQLLEGIPFKTGIVHEDEYWSWQVIAKASKVSVLQENLYNYRQRDNGIMGDKSIDSKMRMLEAKLKRTAYIQEHVPELNDINNMDMLSTCHYLGCEVLKAATGKKHAHYMKVLTATARRCTFSRSFIKQQSMKRRIRSLMMKKWLKLVCCIDIALGLA